MDPKISINENSIKTGIFQLLTQRADKWISTDTLYDSYTKEMRGNSDVTKKNFVEICQTLDSHFKNVYVEHKKNGLFLMFSTNAHLNTEELCTNIPPVNVCDQIEKILKDRNLHYLLTPKQFLDGVDTVLHIVCKHGRYDLAVYVLKYYDVDVEFQNRDGLTAFEVIDFKKQNSVKLAKLLIEYKTNKTNKTKNNDNLSVEILSSPNVYPSQTNNNGNGNSSYCHFYNFVAFFICAIYLVGILHTLGVF